MRTTVVDADWPLLAAAYRTRGALRIVDDVLARVEAAEAAAPESEFRKALRECPPEGRPKMLADHIAASASAVIGLRPGEVMDPEVGFFQLGMDSLMSVTLQRRLSASLGIALPAAVIYEYPTISSLTDALCERMGYATADHSPAAARSGLGATSSATRPGPPGGCGEQTERTCGVSTDDGFDAASNELPPNAIAVIGMAGRFPGADSVTEFWENLSRGEESHHHPVRGGAHRRRSQRQDAGGRRPTFGARPCSTGSTSSTRTTSG